MTLLFNETHPIPVHTIMAIIAIILGGIQLSMKKGGTIHKLLGRIWIGIMMFVAITSFFIHEIKLWGAYSPIHLLSLLTIFTLGVGIYYIRVGNVKRHKQTMITLYFFALIVAGFFTLYPGRIMHQILIG